MNGSTGLMIHLKSDYFCFFVLVIFIKELFRIGLEPYTTERIKLLHCVEFA